MLVDLSQVVGGYLHNTFFEKMDGWVILGFLGQMLFTMRFIVQWLASERLGRSVVPSAFWFFSLGGGGFLLIYAVSRGDPVFIVGQGLGLLIYLRNLMFITRSPSRDGDTKNRPYSRAETCTKRCACTSS